MTWYIRVCTLLFSNYLNIYCFGVETRTWREAEAAEPAIFRAPCERLGGRNVKIKK